MSSKKVSHDTFNDLLGGFTATSQSSNETKTIGEMKKKEVMKQMTPLEAKVFAWIDGKARNLRALLCSLDKILWEGARWQQCGMHQLVAENDVNKMYKKAILAVHPDRQQGTENEELATLLQKELNDAWAEYKKELE
jgi:cyclin G-associated kinase